MNLVLACPACGCLLRVFDANPILVGTQSDFWPDKYTCPRCTSAVQAVDEAVLPRSAHTVDILDLTSEELFAALEGLGLPSERDASMAQVAAAFQRSPVKRVVGSDIPNTQRCSVTLIELVDGTRLYFGASSLGAICYRLAPPPSYADQEIARACTV